MSFTHFSASTALLLLLGFRVWSQLDSRVKLCVVPGQPDLKQACLSKSQSSILGIVIILLANGRIQRSAPQIPAEIPPAQSPSSPACSCSCFHFPAIPHKDPWHQL